MVVRVDKEIFGEAWRLYSERLDKEWSFTDCASFIVMNRMGLTDAFTSDHHFEQAGFNILLKD
jgi:predicted nucleic acid-binding protein